MEKSGLWCVACTLWFKCVRTYDQDSVWLVGSDVSWSSDLCQRDSKSGRQTAANELLQGSCWGVKRSEQRDREEGETEGCNVRSCCFEVPKGRSLTFLDPVLSSLLLRSSHWVVMSPPSKGQETLFPVSCLSWLLPVVLLQLITMRLCFGATGPEDDIYAGPKFGWINVTACRSPTLEHKS